MIKAANPQTSHYICECRGETTHSMKTAVLAHTMFGVASERAACNPIHDSLTYAEAIEQIVYRSTASRRNCA